MSSHPIRLSIDDLPAQVSILRAELREGHTVELISGEDIVGEVRARFTGDVEGGPERRPDFAAQLKQLWGDRVLSADTTAWVREDRDA